MVMLGSPPGYTNPLRLRETEFGKARNVDTYRGYS